MTAAATLMRGRRKAEDQMIDSCVITGPSTRTGPVDPETGERDLTPGALRYPLAGSVAPLDGRCKVQTYEAHESTPQSGQHYFTVQRYYLHLPVGADPVMVNDEVTIASMVLDPTGGPRKMRVAGLLHKTYATAQRILLDELPPTSP